MDSLANPKAITDLVIEQFADELAIRDERIASLEADVVSYRELAQVSVQRLAGLTQQLENISRQRDAIRNEYATFRANLVANQAQVAA